MRKSKNKSRLTLAFLSHAPRGAAEELERLNPHEAAALLEDVPLRLAGPVVGLMSSWRAAACLELMDNPRAAAILRRLPFRDSAGLLRLLTSDKNDAILAEMPVALARRIRNALKYPPGTVGAWIDSDIPTFGEHDRVSDTLAYLRQSETLTHVFLHDVNGAFAGALPVASVLRSEPGARLSELTPISVKPLASGSSVSSAALHEAWDEFLLLPVTGRNRALVGGLSRAGLRKGLGEARRPQRAGSDMLVGHLLWALSVTCGGLLRLLFNPLSGER